MTISCVAEVFFDAGLQLRLEIEDLAVEGDKKLGELLGRQIAQVFSDPLHRRAVIFS